MTRAGVLGAGGKATEKNSILAWGQSFNACRYAVIMPSRMLLQVLIHDSRLHNPQSIECVSGGQYLLSMLIGRQRSISPARNNALDSRSADVEIYCFR